MIKRMARLAGVAGALLMCAGALGADSTRVGEVTIYHSAFPATTLTADVARSVGIQRSSRLGVLNVSVRKDQDGGLGVPVKALVDVDLRDGERPLGRVAMREVETAGGVSYLGQFPIADGQELEFEIRVRPAGATEATTVRLRQEFFTD